MNRRQMLHASAFTGAAFVSGLSFKSAVAAERTIEGESGLLEPMPLAFDPRKLHGISEKLMVSHHEKNYSGAVKNLNKVRTELGQLTKDSPPFLAIALKERELVFHNSMVLHELYFGNLGGDGTTSGPVLQRLSDEFGTAARWEELFRLTGMGLAGGSGWVTLGYDLRDHNLTTSGASNHAQTPAQTLPLLVMDMYEHAYQMDYGADATRYIDAFFQNVPWDQVNHRFDRAERSAKELLA
jgi:superoxide dismutase, Fe-Mn family